MNLRPLPPQGSALPAAPHPDLYDFDIIPRFDLKVKPFLKFFLIFLEFFEKYYLFALLLKNMQKMNNFNDENDGVSGWSSRIWDGRVGKLLRCLFFVQQNDS